MVKYTSPEIIEYARSLADIKNSNFITWGDEWRFLNAAYKKIYSDAITRGDFNYLKEVRLLVRGTSKFQLPDDFYQLAIVCDEIGNEIPRKRITGPYTDIGYEIKNNTIIVYNCHTNVIIKYYPVPETITVKQKRTSNISISSTPVSGFGTEVLLSTNAIYDVSKQTQVYSFSGVSWTTPVLGVDAVCDFATGRVYWKGNSSVVTTVLRPLLTTSGNFIQGTEAGYGWSNDDGTARFTVSNSQLYYNGTRLGITLTNNANRCIYWNGKWALVTRDRIIYEDGSWETTDSQNVMCLLKCDTETGYGYVIRTGAASYAIEGWTPNTVIDYPNNVLFDMTAYQLAILYRTKQNADTTLLEKAYMTVAETYWKTISSDDANYVTIRNVDGVYGKWGIY